jgi:hypothetical protein
MARCRDCGLPIRFARTRKGRQMPIDPRPHPDGNVLLDEFGSVRRVLGKDEPRPTDEVFYIVHRATCPRPRPKR